MSRKTSKSTKKSQNEKPETPVKTENRVNGNYPFYYYIILLMLPFLFLMLLEGALRIFQYGAVYEQWIPLKDKQLALNPDIARRYFYQTKSTPYANKAIFDRVKGENSFRVFVMGGSSAAGYPFTPGGSFAKYIEKNLEILLPGKKIEVVNTSMSAINSYTLADLLPGIIEQQPDAVLIYAGHNEYYGALGVGSSESIGKSRWIVKSVLYMQDFRTFQLMRNIINSVRSLFSGDKKASGTLMAKMVGDQKILFKSDVYQEGIEQFRGNLDEMLAQLKQSGVPVIIGTLASNLKDQKPFISFGNSDIPAAAEVYDQAISKYNSGNFRAADSLFRLAKDLDALKFRAPEEINSTIISLAAKFGYPVVNIDSVFSSISPNGIIGDNLMTDHLHPTINGYQIIGKAFMDEMITQKITPDDLDTRYNSAQRDSLVRQKFYFTSLDSTIGAYRIIILKTDWPYVKEQMPASETMKLFAPKNYKDTLALYVVDNKISWEAAHREMANRYLEEGNVAGFHEEMSVIIDLFPFIYDYYTIAAEQLIKHKYYNDAVPYLNRKYEIEPDAFTAKWLGIIFLNNNKTDESLKYFESAYNMSSGDAQLLYNYAGAFVKKNQHEKALEMLNMCLRLNPDFPGAKKLQAQLLSVMNINVKH